jgi:uncharacterized protein (TIGR00725 family)
MYIWLMKPSEKNPSTVIGIIGAAQGQCTQELYDFAYETGLLLGAKGFTIACGGMGGVMEAACKGVKSSPATFRNQTIGIIPGAQPSEANPYVDLVIPSGIGIARNILIINSAHMLIAFGGGAGTLSEIAFAWQKGKTVLCVTAFGGWAAEMAGKQIDGRYSGLLVPVSSLKEIEEYLST